MAWVRLGSGPVPLVLVPPISDGLWSVHSFAWRLAWRYRRHLRDFRILALSRRQPIPPGFGLERHADDYARAVDALGWGASVWEAVSAGGPIAQWVAIKRPDLVRGLILTVTLHRVDEVTRTVLMDWRRLAAEERWPDLYWSLVDLNARPRGLSRFPWLRLSCRVLPRPADPARFERVIDELVDLDMSSVLPNLRSPTLVIAGAQDSIIRVEIQHEMAAQIPESTLVVYDGFGHAVPSQQPDYARQMTRFVQRCWPGRSS
jgi:pimeloyl-ACP methyl ester carboxylesterase